MNKCAQAAASNGIGFRRPLSIQQQFQAGSQHLAKKMDCARKLKQIIFAARRVSTRATSTAHEPAATTHHAAELLKDIERDLDILGDIERY